MTLVCGMFLVLLLAMFYLDPTTEFRKSFEQVTFRKKRVQEKIFRVHIQFKLLDS
jgi:hypothetical protein